MHNGTIQARHSGIRFPAIITLVLLCALLLLTGTVAGSSDGTVVFTAVLTHAPTALFTANETAGTASLPVEFMDQSIDMPTSWLWDFGDGTNSTGQNPVHLFTQGVYTVKLTVANIAGNSTLVAPGYITVLPISESVVPPPSSPAYGSGGGSGGGGSATSQRSAGTLPASGSGTGLSGRPQLAPVQESLAVQTIDLSPYSQFITNATGQPGLRINRKMTEQAGAIIVVSGKTVEIIRPAFTLTITAETITEDRDIILAVNIQSIRISVTSIEANVDGVGRVTSSFTAGLDSLPPGSGITTTIDGQVTSWENERFHSAVADRGDETHAIAFTMTVRKTNIIATLPATIRMSVPAEWVQANGGPGSIAIVRLVDDQTCTVLETIFSGYDPEGNMEFVADSPHGLSVFGFIATKVLTPGGNGQLTIIAAIVQNPVVAIALNGMNSVVSAIGMWGLAILVILIIVLAAAFVVRRKGIIIKQAGRDKK